MNVKIPKFFYRDIRRQIQRMNELYEKKGNVQSVMKDCLAPVADRLPQGRTLDSAVADIQETVGLFYDSMTKGVSAADIKKQLSETIASMTDEQAYVYLATLERTFAACDRHIASGEAMPTSERLTDEIRKSVECQGGKSVAERIDNLVEGIAGDVFKASLYISGGDEFRSLAREEGLSAEFCGAKGAEVLKSGIEGQVRYAFAACAVYEKVLRGEIDGVVPQDADPRVLAVLTSAGLEKASILVRMMRGEVDRELLEELLDRVALVLKWVLTKVFQAFIVVTGGVIAVAAVAFFSWAGLVAEVAIAIGLVVGLVCAKLSLEEAKDAAEAVMTVVKAGILFAGCAVESAWNWLRGERVVEARAEACFGT